MDDVFISYAREDEARAKKLAAAFEAAGWSVFWDRTIPTGKTWREVIGKALDEARVVIVLWSATSVESRWGREEADDGQRRGILAPVRVDDVVLPIGFRSIQTAAPLRKRRQHRQSHNRWRK